MSPPLTDSLSKQDRVPLTSLESDCRNSEAILLGLLEVPSPDYLRRSFMIFSLDFRYSFRRCRKGQHLCMHDQPRVRGSQAPTINRTIVSQGIPKKICGTHEYNVGSQNLLLFFWDVLLLRLLIIRYTFESSVPAATSSYSESDLSHLNEVTPTSYHPISDWI